MDYILSERLPALVRPAFDLVLQRIRSLKRCVQACGCKKMTPRHAPQFGSRLHFKRCQPVPKETPFPFFSGTPFFGTPFFLFFGFFLALQRLARLKCNLEPNCKHIWGSLFCSHTPARSVLDFESFAGRGQMLDGRVLGASQAEYNPFGKRPLKREVWRPLRRRARRSWRTAQALTSCAPTRAQDTMVVFGGVLQRVWLGRPQLLQQLLKFWVLAAVALVKVRLPDALLPSAAFPGTPITVAAQEDQSGKAVGRVPEFEDVVALLRGELRDLVHHDKVVSDRSR